VRTAIAWLISLAVFYALTEDQPYLQENIAAVVLAALGTIVVMVAAANWGSGVRLPAKPLAAALRSFAQIPRGVAIVSARILRALFTGGILRGRTAREPFRYGKSHDAGDVGRRALTTYGTCLAPDTILVAFVAEDDEVLIHRVR